jgi:hypothetical protein
MNLCGGVIPIGYESGWAPEPIWKLRKREKFWPAGIQTPAIQPIAVLTELPPIVTDTLQKT